MANKSKKAQNNKNLIIGICSAVALIIVVVVVAILIKNNNGNTIDDNYFVSDGSKYVLTIDLSSESTEAEDCISETEVSDNSATTEDCVSQNNAQSPVKMHSVYTYEGDTITGLKSYYEYTDADSAKAAYDIMLTEASDGELNDAVLNGKYIVFTSSAEDYADMTTSDVKQQIEFIEMLQSMNSDDSEDVEEITEIDESEE